MKQPCSFHPWHRRFFRPGRRLRRAWAPLARSAALPQPEQQAALIAGGRGNQLYCRRNGNWLYRRWSSNWLNRRRSGGAGGRRQRQRLDPGQQGVVLRIGTDRDAKLVAQARFIEKSDQDSLLLESEVSVLAASIGRGGQHKVGLALQNRPAHLRSSTVTRSRSFLSRTHFSL